MRRGATPIRNLAHFEGEPELGYTSKKELAHFRGSQNWATPP
jgi:hypothetical protein